MLLVLSNSRAARCSSRNSSRDPHRRVGFKTCHVGEQLPQVVVIGHSVLVLDHDPRLGVGPSFDPTAEDVRAEASDRPLGSLQHELQAQRFTEEFQAPGPRQPRCEVSSLTRPDLSNAYRFKGRYLGLAHCLRPRSSDASRFIIRLNCANAGSENSCSTRTRLARSVGAPARSASARPRGAAHAPPAAVDAGRRGGY